MDRELTFHPEKEHARDLIYSEYSSCDRSVHLLIQESPSVPYDVHLKVYRETVSAYLSSDEIGPPESFIENMLSCFDGLAQAAGLPLEEWRTLGIHLLLRAKNAFYIVTSCEAEVLLRAGDSLVPVVEACNSERLRHDGGAVQRELFPSRLGDLLSALKLDTACLDDRDLVLGCTESDKAAVLEGLSNPDWLEPDVGAELRASRRSIVSPAVTRRILVLHFGGGVKRAAQPVEARRRSFRVPSFRITRRRVATAGAAIGALAIVGVLWRWSGVERHAGTPGVNAPNERTDPRAGDEVSPSGPSEGKARDAPTWRLTEAWRRSFAGPVTSSPLLAEGRVIFGCRDGVVYAVDPVSGSNLWTFSASGGVGASPAIYGESAVVADYNGYVYRLSVADGRLVWKTKLATSVVSSPAVGGDRVLVCGVDGNAYCLSARDGEVVWKKGTRGRIRGSAVATDGGFLVPSYDGYLYSFSAVLGDVSWRAALGGPVSASPAVRDGWVVIGGPDGGVRCFGAADGAPKWNFTAGDAVKSGLAIDGDKVLFGSNDGCLYCVDLASGGMRWKYQTGGLVLGRPLVRDGVVYVGSYDGRMYGLGADDGRPLCAFEVGAEVFSSPAVDDERVYFGTNRGDFIALRRER